MLPEMNLTRASILLRDGALLCVAAAECYIGGDHNTRRVKIDRGLRLRNAASLSEGLRKTLLIIFGPI